MRDIKTTFIDINLLLPEKKVAIVGCIAAIIVEASILKVFLMYRISFFNYPRHVLANALKIIHLFISVM